MVRITDAVKRAALSRLLLEGATSKAPGEKLEEKLASLVLPEDFLGGMRVLIFVPIDFTFSISTST
jgi:alkyl hydroperoxide reductase subunit AhpC